MPLILLLIHSFTLWSRPRVSFKRFASSWLTAEQAATLKNAKQNNENKSRNSSPEAAEGKMSARDRLLQSLDMKKLACLKMKKENPDKRFFEAAHI